MLSRIPVRMFLLFFCMSWLLCTSSISLALSYENGDLYSREKRAEETIRVINRAPNIQGLTGLLVMDSAFTRPAGTIAIGASGMIESSANPDYSLIQTPITITFGLTDTIEAGIKMKYVNYKQGVESGLGDSEVALKWRWNTHNAVFPELAVGLAGIIPTASEATGAAKGLNDVTDWGAKFMVMATSESRIFDNSVLGIYLEAQAVFIDGFSAGVTTATQDRYGIINVGVLLPISPGNALQAMLELSDTVGKRRTNTVLAEGDQTVITPALRYVTEAVSITAGAQLLRKNSAAYDDTIRWVGTLSYQF